MMFNPWKWLTVTVKPWLWRPFVEVWQDTWYWELGVKVYIDWSPGFHFDEFGILFGFGPWRVNFGIRDNN